jgi:hypothetical protein
MRLLPRIIFYKVRAFQTYTILMYSVHVSESLRLLPFIADAKQNKDINSKLTFMYIYMYSRMVPYIIFILAQ